MGLLILFATAAALIIAVATLVLIQQLLRPARKTYAVALARRLATEPSELNFESYEQTFTFPDGLSSPGWVIDGHDANGPVVVVTHGWGDSRYGSLTRATVLAPFVSKLVMYDLRGHGESTAPVSKLSTIEVDDLLAVLEQIDHQGKPIVLFGASMGAGVSIVAAAKSNDAAIVGVIADGPYRFPLEPIIGQMLVYKIVPYPMVWLAQAHFSFWHGGLKGFDRMLHAQRLNCPLLVLHGNEDRICKYESGKAIADAAPNGKLITFEGGGHLDLAWFDEAKFCGALESFFDEVAGEPDRMPDYEKQE